MIRKKYGNGVDNSYTATQPATQLADLAPRSSCITKHSEHCENFRYETLKSPLFKNLVWLPYFISYEKSQEIQGKLLPVASMTE